MLQPSVVQANSDLKTMELSLRDTEAKIIHLTFEQYLFKLGIALSAGDALGLHWGRCGVPSDLPALHPGEPP